MDNRLIVLGAAAALLLAGCREEEGITSYSAPKPDKPPGVAPEPEPEAKVRLLAAIIPQDEQSWFFKLAGPVAAVSAQEKAFDDFINSVRFPGGGKKIAWQAPDGWREEPGKGGMRYATFRMGPADAPLELSVSQAGGTLLDNINRWRRQDLGIPDITKGRLSKVAREVQVEGNRVIRVDMSGPGGKGGMKPPFGS